MPLQGVTRPDLAIGEVILCVPDRIEEARIEGALPARVVVRRAHTTGDLDRMLRTAGDRLQMVVVSPRDAMNSSTAPIVRDFTRRRPGVAFVGYCRPAREHSRDMIDLAGAGIHEVVFRDSTDWGDALRQTLGRAVQACGAAEASVRLSGLVPSELQPLIEYCLFFPQLATSVSRVASALGVNRKTLVNYTDRAGFPPPSVLISWCRLIIVAHMLSSRGGSVERIALALEYPSATALRNTMRRYTKLRPGALREHGMEILLEAFSQTLRQVCDASVTRRAS